MRDRKYFFLLILVLIIITISFVLISMWGYHFYYANKNGQAIIDQEKKTASIEKNVVNDSLRYLTNPLNEYPLIDFPANETDTSGDSILMAKIIQYRTLRNEIVEMIRKKRSHSELSSASGQISELQKDIEDLKNKNDTIIRENERLNNLVRELLDKNKTQSRVLVAAPRSKNIETSATRLPVLVSHLRFAAYEVNKNKAETNLAIRAEKIIGSFQLNIKAFNNNNKVFIVVLQPNGKILLNNDSRLKTFITQNGKKQYSAVIHFDNKKDNHTRVSFSIEVSHLQKGKYIMQIYHQGVLIGKLTKTLF